jgi:hypothetical protein
MLDEAAIARIAEAYLAQIPRPAVGQLRVTDKMPTNFFFAGLIHLALPNAPIIHTGAIPSTPASPVFPSCSPPSNITPTTWRSWGAIIGATGS